jgi:hypothetical protein
MKLDSVKTTRLLEHALNFYRPPKRLNEEYRAGGEHQPAEPNWDESYHDDIKAIAKEHFLTNTPPTKEQFINGVRALNESPLVKQGVFGNRYSAAKMNDFMIAVQSMTNRSRKDVIEALFVNIDEHNIADRINFVIMTVNQELSDRFPEENRNVSHEQPGIIPAYTYPERFPRIKASAVIKIAKYVNAQPSVGRGDKNRAQMYEFVFRLARQWRNHLPIRDYIDVFVLMHILTDKSGPGFPTTDDDALTTNDVEPPDDLSVKKADPTAAIDEISSLPEPHAADSEVMNVDTSTNADNPTPTATDASNQIPSRIQTTAYRILRDTRLARHVKGLHNNRCQVCGHTIILPDGSCYAEAHHIRPLGEPHNGPDVAENILCLCPNHHTEMDYLASAIDTNELHAAQGHSIGDQYVSYHNDLRRRFLHSKETATKASFSEESRSGVGQSLT